MIIRHFEMIFMIDLSKRLNLIQGDCLEIMKELPTKSINLILCDLPYGITACEWDSIIDLNKLWVQYKRILKLDGTVVLTASMPFTAILVCSNIKWFSHSWIWKKAQGTNFLLSNNQPLKVHEDILVFRKPNNYDINYFLNLRNYFKNLLNQTNRTKKQLMHEFGQSLDHCFRFNSEQWGLPTKEAYLKIISYLKDNKFRSYEDLKNEYDLEFISKTARYNPQKTEGNKYISGKGFSGDVTNNVEKIQTINEGTRLPITILEFNRETGLHPTQKPIKLLEYLVKTYTREKDLVLDNCMGSGSTGVACVNTNRRFIGMELDKGYFDIATKRISEWENQSRLTDKAKGVL